MEDKAGVRENKLRELYADIPGPIVDLVSQMLQYNPYFRPSARECLDSKVFDSVQNPEIELEYPEPISIKVDSHPDYKSNLNCTIIEPEKEKELLEVFRLLIS